jgi:hypothetical protein
MQQTPRRGSQVIKVVAQLGRHGIGRQVEHGLAFTYRAQSHGKEAALISQRLAAITFRQIQGDGCRRPVQLITQGPHKLERDNAKVEVTGEKVSTERFHVYSINGQSFAVALAEPDAPGESNSFLSASIAARSHLSSRWAALKSVCIGRL